MRNLRIMEERVRPFGRLPSVSLLVVLLCHPLTSLAQFDQLEYVGHDEVNPFHLMHAEVVGTNVYISEGLGSNGMETYDISNPANPVRVDQDGPVTWRTRAYPEIDRLFGFGHLEGVQLYDISVTANLLREYDPAPGTSYEGGALRGDLLYVAAHQQGIEILDVSDPGPIVKLGTIDLGNHSAWDVEVLDHYLLVANGRFGLSIVDLDSDPPVEVAEVPFLGLANDILVAGGVGYLSLGPGGLASLDLSDPGNPLVLDLNTETAGNLTEIDLLGDLLVAGAWVRLETYDVSDPANIVLVGSEDSKTWAMGASFNDEIEDPIIAVADWRGVTTYRPNADSGPDIELSTPRIDFGAVPVSADTVVYVYNRGSSTLDVVEVVVPADISVAPDAFSVPPGGIQAVTITATGPAQVSSFLRYSTNDPDETTVRQYVYMNNSAFPQIGDLAPDFELLGTDGQLHRISDHPGEVVFLEFGANW